MQATAIILIALILINIIITLIFLSKGTSSKGWEDGSEYNRMFSLRTVATITVEVVRQEKVEVMGGMTPAIQLVTKTDTEVIPAHLGPAWFIESQMRAFRANEKIEIRGSRVTIKDKPVIMATEVKIGHDVLTLRDYNGHPVWNAWKRR